MVFLMSKYKAIFKLRGFDFMNYIYIQTQTNLAGCSDVQGCKKLITCNCMRKTDHSGQRKGKNRNVTIFLIL